MAVWGRAMMAMMALAALSACEYAEEGEPRPSPVPSSPATSSPAVPADIFQVQATPDPAQLLRLNRMTEQVNQLLATKTEMTLGMTGPIGEPNTVAEKASTDLPVRLSGSGMAEPGQYIVKVACVGDTAMRFAVHDGDGLAVSPKIAQPDSPWSPCGKATSVRRTLKSGWVTVEIQGKTRGVEAVGGVHVVKTAKP